MDERLVLSLINASDNLLETYMGISQSVDHITRLFPSVVGGVISDEAEVSQEVEALERTIEEAYVKVFFLDQNLGVLEHLMKVDRNDVKEVGELEMVRSKSICEFVNLRICVTDSYGLYCFAIGT